MNKSILLLVALLLLAVPIRAQNSAMVAEMEKALAAEEKASTLEAVLEAAHRLESIAQRYKGEWLPLYWSAHVYTQVALFSKDRRYGAYLHLAQAYLEMASRAHPNKSEVDAAEFAALEANLESFWSGYYRAVFKDDEKAAKHEAQKVAALDRADKADPKNPRAAMLRGLELMRAEATRAEGRVKLKEAIQKYEEFKPASSIHPRWGRQWIDFWMKKYPEVKAGS